MAIPDARTRHLFFTGKGGVGKTSLSCATGLALAEAGRRVLIVSTDPASNLDEVLGVALAQTPTAIPGATGLFALNIDPEAAARDYRERMVAPYRGLLPAAAITSMEEQFSGACTLEIAAFDEFSKLLGDPTATVQFEHVIFDTAPTGHTLRLLTLPSAWSEFIGSTTGGASCLGPLAGLEQQKALYAATVEQLADPARTTLILVSRPETAALREAERTREELAALGVGHPHLAINGVLAVAETDDAIAAAMMRRGAEALAALPAGLAALPVTLTPLLPLSTLGLAALRQMANPERVPPPALDPEIDCALPGPLSCLVDELAQAGRGVILTMGKGGVGKTTLAAAIALALARRGHPVRLSTTDPAAHVAEAVGESIPGLSVSRIDPTAEVTAYRAEVLAKAAANLDPNGRAMLEEDLRSPCTEEIAVFRAFARAVDGGQDGFVVLDTAPTGHTLLLLDAAEAYHREVTRTQGDLPEAVRQLLPRLRDPDFTRVLVVTLPEATPVHEAERLQRDLRRAGIEPFAWVINQSLLASGTRHPLLRQRGLAEAPLIRQVAATLSQRSVLVPWLAEPPVGGHGLEHSIQVRSLDFNLDLGPYSMSHPYDKLTLASGATLIFTPCPGTKDTTLDDAVKTLKEAGAQALVTLMPEEELTKFAAESIPGACAASGIQWFHLPVEDDHAPDERFATAFATQKQILLSLLEQQGTLAIHCRGGSGRTGFMAAILLLESGMDREDVVRQVQGLRPHALKMPVHTDYLDQTYP